MTNVTYFRQCGLAQGAQAIVGWIEERGAKLGASVEIPELGGFWKVTGVGTSRMSKQDVRAKEALARQPFTALKSYRGNK